MEHRITASIYVVTKPMFGNIINLHDGTATRSVVVVENGGRRSVRASADGVYKLSIAHQESNENPGFTNQRSVVRLEQRIAVSESDKTVTGYVQLITSVPKDVMTAADLAKLVDALISFIVSEENPDADALPTGVTNTDLGAVPRIYAGEP